MTSPMEEVFEPGRILDGKYRIERLLGEGGMGRVLKAHHLHLDEPRAIKVPKPDLMARPQAIARFMKEARVASKITSEYVARIHDLGTLESGLPFIVMEYLDGQDLAALLSKEGPLPVDVLVDLMLQTCEALAEAHSIGIVHRDLKPPNLYCVRRRDGTSVVKVLDFGISKMKKMQSVSSAHLTQAGAMLGSPHYMSPEQSQSATEVDARTDIWSLGVILYELLSGTVPFAAESLQGLGVRIATSLPKPLSQLRPRLPSDLEAVVSRCIEKQVSDRYQTVAELAWALAPFGSEGAKLSAQRTERIIDTARRADLLPISSEQPSEATPADPGTPHIARSRSESTMEDVVAGTMEYVQADANIADPFASVETPPRGTHAPVTKSSSDGLSGQEAVTKRTARRSTISIGLLSASALALLAWTLSGADEPSAGVSGVSFDVPPPTPAPSATPPGGDVAQDGAPAPTATESASSSTQLVPAPPRSGTTTFHPSPSAPTLSPTLSPVTPPPPKSAAARAKTSLTPPTSKKAENCSTPYTIDKEGHKRFDGRCFE